MPTEPPVATRYGSLPLFPIFFVNFIGTLGFSLVLPFLVFLVTAWGGNAVVYGIAGATYSAFQLLGAPVLGRWSDAYGRRRVLLLSQLGTLVSWLIFLGAFALPRTPLLNVESAALGSFVLTLPLAVLLLARALDGLTGGNVSVANAYLADVTPAEDRAANFGKMAVSSNLGFILGPALAGLLGATAFGEVGPVAIAALISLVATLVIALRLPESRPCVLERSPEHRNVRKLFGQEQRDCFDMKGAAKLTARRLLDLPGAAPLLAIYFLVMLGFNFFYVTFPVYAVGTLDWSLAETGVFFSVMGLLMVVVQGPVLGWVSKHVPDRALIIAGGLILTLSFRLFDTHTTWVIYLAVALMALGNGVMWPSVLSALSKTAGDTYQGAVQGFAGSLGAVASIAGLVIGGIAYATLGSKVFWTSAAIILVGAAIGAYPSYPAGGARATVSAHGA